MPKFAAGSPQVQFRRRDGAIFTKTFHTQAAQVKAIKAWRARGGKVTGTGLYMPKGMTYGQYMPKRGSMGMGKRRKYKNYYL